MTKINNYSVTVDKKDIVGAILAFKQDGAVRTAGMEAERFVLNGNGSLPDAATHEAFYLTLKKTLGDRISVEPGAHQIELKTGVHTDASGIKGELKECFAQLCIAADRHGLQIVPASDLPQFDAATLRRNLVAKHDPETGKVRRAFEMMKAYERHDRSVIGDWGASTISVQFTHNAADATTLLRWLRVHAALSPLSFAAFENRERTDGLYHEGIVRRRALGERGLVAPDVFLSADAEDFVERHVERIVANRLLTVLDTNGEDAILDTPTAFQDLPPELRTLGNYFQAAAFTWNVTKIKTPIDEAALADGKIVVANILAEVRDMDTSERGAYAAADWFCDLTASDISLSCAEACLEECGVPVLTDPERALAKINEALRAVECDPRHLDTVFGNTTLRGTIGKLCLPIAGPDSSVFWRTSLASASPICKAPEPQARVCAWTPTVRKFNQ